MIHFARHGLRPLVRLMLVMLFTTFLAGAAQLCRADDPKPDPAGIATGDKTTAVDAGGTSFVVTQPTGADAKDPAKVKAYNDFKAMADKEPLAMKLSDTVGHVRVATNFTWTLNTGYLVLFMQAGFALLTCGLVRKKNAGHLMMLNFAAYVFAFLAYWAVGFAFQYGGVAISAAPTTLGGTPTLNHFALSSGLGGLLGGKGFFLAGPGYDAGVNVLTMFEVVFMETAGYIIVGAICERITFGAFILCELFMGGILYPIFGCWVWGGGWMSQLGVSKGCRSASRGRFRRTTSPLWSPAPSSCCLAGWASIPARPLRGPICASP
jgi:Amt family ammonium transporter